MKKSYKTVLACKEIFTIEACSIYEHIEKLFLEINQKLNAYNDHMDGNVPVSFSKLSQELLISG